MSTNNYILNLLNIKDKNIHILTDKVTNKVIKVIKRIAFGFRFFKGFKARIMICKGLIKIKKIANA